MSYTLLTRRMDTTGKFELSHSHMLIELSAKSSSDLKVKRELCSIKFNFVKK